MITEIVKNEKVVGLKLDLDIISDISMYPDLKFIATPCTGTDHIKVEGVDIIHLDSLWKKTRGALISSTAEHTWSLILQLAKRKRIQLSGKTIGIIGMGRIGSMIYRYAKAFEMNVIYHDIKTSHYTDLKKVLKQSDIITIHIPLNNKTKEMIKKKELKLMKPTVLIINTSRAEIFSEKALYNMLYNRHIGGYADDFIETYPCITDIMNNQHFFRDIIRTNHIGGNCIEAREATNKYIDERISEYLCN